MRDAERDQHGLCWVGHEIPSRVCKPCGRQQQCGCSSTVTELHMQGRECRSAGSSPTAGGSAETSQLCLNCHILGEWSHRGASERDQRRRSTWCPSLVIRSQDWSQSLCHDTRLPTLWRLTREMSCHRQLTLEMELAAVRRRLNPSTGPQVAIP